MTQHQPPTRPGTPRCDFLRYCLQSKPSAIRHRRPIQFRLRRAVYPEMYGRGVGEQYGTTPDRDLIPAGTMPQILWLLLPQKPVSSTGAHCMACCHDDHDDQAAFRHNRSRTGAWTMDWHSLPWTQLGWTALFALIAGCGFPDRDAHSRPGVGRRLFGRRAPSRVTLADDPLLGGFTIPAPARSSSITVRPPVDHRGAGCWSGLSAPERRRRRGAAWPGSSCRHTLGRAFLALLKVLKGGLDVR
jgi:hypothetical protein